MKPAFIRTVADRAVRRREVIGGDRRPAGSGRGPGAGCTAGEWGDHGSSAAVRWRRLLPATLIVCAAVVDIVSPQAVSTFPLLAAAPVAAAPLLSLAGTIATGAAASLTGVLLVLGRGGPPVGISHATAQGSLVVLTLFAVALNRLMARDRRRLRSARDVAETVQRAVLPAPPDRIGPLAVAARYTAAAEEAAIGGDLYAVLETPYGVRMMVADVRGKGLGAVTTVAGLLGTFFEAAAHTPDLPELVHRLEGRCQRMNALPGDREAAETFATAVVAELSADGATLHVANRGHPAPLLVGGGRARSLEPGTPALPLGLADLGGPDVPVDRFEMPKGATLVLFTDGLTEARDRTGAFYDPTPCLSRSISSAPDRVLDTLTADLARHTGGRLSDDSALLAVTRLPGTHSR